MSAVSRETHRQIADLPVPRRRAVCFRATIYPIGAGSASRASQLSGARHTSVRGLPLSSVYDSLDGNGQTFLLAAAGNLGQFWVSPRTNSGERLRSNVSAYRTPACANEKPLRWLASSGLQGRTNGLQITAGTAIS